MRGEGGQALMEAISGGTLFAASLMKRETFRLFNILSLLANLYWGIKYEIFVLYHCFPRPKMTL